MLSAQASSFRHKSRLAISLSWVGGYVNVILLIACGQTVSHQTGNTTRFGNLLGDSLLHKPAAAIEAGFFALIIGSFLLGSASSGWMIEAARRSGRRSKFLLPMIAEAMLLCVLVFLLGRHHPLSLEKPSDRAALSLIAGIAALAMGLQNATITRISGAVVRTTHLTGVVTDFGLELVHLWQNKAERFQSIQRLVLLGSIFGSFLLGVVAGTVLFEKFGATALLVPMLFLTGLILQSFFTPASSEN